MNEKIKITIWGDEVGKLVWKNGNSYFLYNQNFLQKGLDLFPLSASIHSVYAQRPISGDIYEKKFLSLPHFIADSLPDAWGKYLFYLWKKSNKLSDSDFTPLERLSLIGDGAIGALEFSPETKIAKETEVNLADLANAAQRFRDLDTPVSLKSEDYSALQPLIAIGIFAGGRQPKAIVAINDETGEIRSGQTNDLNGYTHYLLKFGDEQLSSAEIEMTYYQMACKAGIDMMPSRLLNIEGRNHFLTQRFDRVNGEKLHTQTLLAMDTDAESYESLVDICRKLHLPESQCEEVFRRMVFNVLSNNTDDHNKNFSFVMNRRGEWSLSPAYDLTYIMSNVNGTPDTAHCMYIRSKTTNISKSDVLEFAKCEGVRQPEKIIKEVAEALLGFRVLAKTNGVKKFLINRIENCIYNHLTEWDVIQKKELNFSYNIDNNKVEDAHLVQTFRGDIHLLAKVNEEDYRYIIRRKTDLYNELVSTGLLNVSADKMQTLVEDYIMPKVKEKKG